MRGLFREYEQALGVDLCFQQFDAELATLPGAYAAPTRNPAAGPGRRGGWPAASPCARSTVDYANAGEMKRLFVRKAFRGFGLGRQLAEHVLDVARRAGYGRVLLDTLDDMESARALYEDLGFEEIPPYYHNPIAGEDVPQGRYL